MINKKLTVKAALFGVLASLLISIILMCCVSAFILTNGLLPSELTNIITIAALGAGSFTGGIVASRITKSAGMITGLITGFAVFLLITIIGLCRSSDSITYLTFIRLAVTVVLGGIGGIIGVNKKEKVHIK